MTNTSFFGHPRGLSTLFFTEMWERFTYYGMRALLILFITAPVAEGGLGYPVVIAGAIYGLYTASAYLASLPGGWIADRLLGQRRAVLYGGILMAIGSLSMTLRSVTSFYLGLAIIVAGTGLLKPNVSTMVGQLYAPGDYRRDAAFSIFYMGINLGAFLAPLACGYVGQRIDWRLGFGLAGIGMTLGLVQYVLGWKRLGTAGLEPAPATPAERAGYRRQVLIGLAVLVGLIVVLVMSGVGAKQISDGFGVGLVVITFGVFAWLILGRGWTAAERKRLIVVFCLFLASALFWSVFEQAGSTLNLFAERNTNNVVLGYSFPASWFQSLNAMFIVVFAPVMAWLWVRLGDRNPSSPMKFVFGLVFAGLGFAVLIGPASVAMNGARVSPMWLTITYLFHTFGELCLSPVGLSAMTKLAPVRVAGFVMGVWFLSTSVGNYMGGRLASLYEAQPLPTLFTGVALSAFIAALALLVFVRPIRRLMGDIK